MARVQIVEGGNFATVTIDRLTREIPIIWKNGCPEFDGLVAVGVRVGTSGAKIWYSQASIGIDAREEKHGRRRYLLGAWSPLNTVNRSFANVTILQFWDQVPDELKSRR